MGTYWHDRAIVLASFCLHDGTIMPWRWHSNALAMVKLCPAAGTTGNLPWGEEGGKSPGKLFLVAIELDRFFSAIVKQNIDNLLFNRIF